MLISYTAIMCLRIANCNLQIVDKISFPTIIYPMLFYFLLLISIYVYKKIGVAFYRHLLH